MRVHHMVRFPNWVGTIFGRILDWMSIYTTIVSKSAWNRLQIDVLHKGKGAVGG